MDKLQKHITRSLLTTGFVVVTLIFASCKASETPIAEDEDTKAKETLQGVWGNELEGNTTFSVKGDTIFFNDSLSSPAAFFVRNDSLIIKYHDEVRYPIRSLTASSFTFINKDGDEVELTKLSNRAPKSVENGYVAPNQGKRIKKDSVLVYGDIHFHAYTQVNPTTYKVYRQTTNNDGLSVESAYYDNIVYIGLYNGSTKVFGQNFDKKAFSKFVPQSYIDRAILSEIIIDSVSAKGVRFIAVLSIPDSYTNYRVNIDISPDGKKALSL